MRWYLLRPSGVVPGAHGLFRRAGIPRTAKGARRLCSAGDAVIVAIGCSDWARLPNPRSDHHRTDVGTISASLTRTSRLRLASRASDVPIGEHDAFHRVPSPVIRSRLHRTRTWRRLRSLGRSCSTSPAARVLTNA